MPVSKLKAAKLANFDFDLKKVLFEELGYANNPEIKVIDTQQVGRRIPDINAAYVVRDIHIAYFSYFEYVDLEKIRQLHRAVWSESKTPLLFVILPGEIRIYNSYALPASSIEELDDETRLLRHLTQLTDLETARQQIHQELYLNHYDRIHLETGAFWDASDGRRINKNTRADYRLLHEMSTLRRKLIQAKLSNELAYLLLGRSILIRYLEDRNILNTRDWLISNSGKNYREVLHSINDTYAFFEALSNKLHGDLFPVDEDERAAVTQKHLNLVADFLDGAILETGQLAFWPYNFEYIPIELISGIYDTFLKPEDRKNGGTYYTPHTLVDFVIEETLALEVTKSNMNILDPACGSGVFLVRAYQRLVNAWIKENSGKKPSGYQLQKLISENIFGVDIDASAIRMAAFNLYLTMLDQMSTSEIKRFEFEFPTLREQNLFVGDFFSDEVQSQLLEIRFDRIIGNPPWVSGLTHKARNWILQRGYQVGDQQLAQAFLLAAPELCKQDGEIALLAPAKSTISVISGPHESFRQHFFRHHHIRAVFNLSALCYELFEDAIHPTIIIFYTPNKPDLDEKFVYVTPKPTSLFQQMGTITLETDDIKYLSPNKVLEFPHIWKIALWGTPRDEAFIERITNYPTLEEKAQDFEWGIHEGLIQGSKSRKPASWLENIPFLNVKKFQPYTLNKESLDENPPTTFERTRNPDITHAPLALIRQSPASGKCTAAFCEFDIAYTNSVSGITGRRGQEWALKWLVIYINSPLARYYHFMTSTRWAIERGNILHNEYKKMPFKIPATESTDPRISEALKLFDKITSLQNTSRLFDASYKTKIQHIEERLAEIVFEVFNIYPAERQLIYDTIKYGIDFFYWGKRKNRKPNGSVAVTPPSSKLLREYALTFTKAANTLLTYQKQSLHARVYQNGTPLNIIGFEKVQNIEPTEIEIVANPNDIHTVLDRLDKALLQQKSSSLYIRRQVRIYDGNWLYFVKPAEQRFWTKSQALVDADETISEWLVESKNTHPEIETYG